MGDTNESRFPTYQPDNLPSPQGIPLSRAISTGEVPVPNPEEIRADYQDTPQSWPYRFINELRVRTQKEGFTPNLDQANQYALQALETAYPENSLTTTPDINDNKLKDSLVGIHTAILRQWIEDAKTGKTTPEMASLLALMTMEKMKDSFEKFLQEYLKMSFTVANIGSQIIEDSTAPEGLKGPKIEHTLSLTASRSGDYLPKIGNLDTMALQLLGHYRAFVLAEETLKAARENRPIDPNLVNTLWQANNVRVATISSLQEKNTVPQNLPTQNQQPA